MRRLFARFIISAVYLFSGHVATRLVRPSLPLRAGRVADGRTKRVGRKQSD